MTLPSAFFGVILLPEVQDISSFFSSNVVDHQTDSGFKLSQIAQRSLTEVRLIVFLHGDLKDVILSSLEYAYLNSIVSPFLSRTVFFLNSIIIDLIVNKNTERRDTYSVEIKIKEIVQTGLAGLILIADLASYGFGRRGDLIKIANSLFENVFSIGEDVADVLRSTVSDVTEFPMNESDPITESAVIDATNTNSKGQSFTDLVGD